MNLKHIFDLSKIEELFHAKVKHGQLFLFKNKDLVVIFRSLTVQETKDIIELSPFINEIMLENLICSLTYITSNKDKEYLIAKTPCFFIKSVAEKISSLSVLQEEKDFKSKIIDSRNTASTAQSVIEILIAKAYPGMKPSEIENLTQFKQIDLLGKSEKIAKEMLDLGNKNNANDALKSLRGATVIGGSITDPGAGDLPEFNNGQ